MNTDNDIIYLDYNATTPIAPEVAEAMKPFLDIYFGNPSSSHKFGIEAKMAVENARQSVAQLVHAKAEEIVFTSGGSESNNFAIKGIAYAYKEKGKHIITSSIEHPAVIEVCKFLEEEGFEVSYLPVDEYGMVSEENLLAALRPDTVLVSIMHANNEVGSIQNIRALSTITHNHGAIFHCDAAQSVGKTKVDVESMGVDLLSIAAHKFYGPKGIGALYIKNGIKPKKLIHGANHEHNMRAGTENILEIAGLGKAAEVAHRDLDKNIQHFSDMRDLLESNLKAAFPNIKINAEEAPRLPNTLSVSFKGIEANVLLDELNHIAASAGAACHTDNIDVSAVLEAMHVPINFAMGTIRFSVGRSTTEEEIQKASQEIIDAIKRIRNENEQVEEAPVTEKIKLTHFTHGLGCACKLRPQDLEQVLKNMPKIVNPNVIVGTETSDDACVYSLNAEQALVQTLDFFTPIVDDPYAFGAIAAANALSDVYAMGAQPIFALNIVGFPEKRLPLSVLEEILKGASDKSQEAGIPVLGGHTVEDPEPKFGMVVSGLVHPNEIIKNIGAQDGDYLVLSKPIGSGILSTAMKRGILDETTCNIVIETMSTLNKQAAHLARQYGVRAMTDVTGFGLLGHLREMLDAEMGVVLNFNDIPQLPKAYDLAVSGIIPGGTLNNKSWLEKDVIYDRNLSDVEKILLNDAQTSGGLLMAIPEEEIDGFISECDEINLNYVNIGRFSADLRGKIKVIK